MKEIIEHRKNLENLWNVQDYNEDSTYETAESLLEKGHSFIEEPNLVAYIANFNKAVEDSFKGIGEPIFIEEIEKAKKDMSKLVKKVITDSRGHKRAVYVKPDDGKKDDKKSSGEKSEDDYKATMKEKYKAVPSTSDELKKVKQFTLTSPLAKTKEKLAEWKGKMESAKGQDKEDAKKVVELLEARADFVAAATGDKEHFNSKKTEEKPKGGGTKKLTKEQKIEAIKIVNDAMVGGDGDRIKDKINNGNLKSAIKEARKTAEARREAGGVERPKDLEKLADALEKMGGEKPKEKPKYKEGSMAKMFTDKFPEATVTEEKKGGDVIVKVNGSVAYNKSTKGLSNDEKMTAMENALKRSEAGKKTEALTPTEVKTEKLKEGSDATKLSSETLGKLQRAVYDIQLVNEKYKVFDRDAVEDIADGFIFNKPDVKAAVKLIGDAEANNRKMNNVLNGEWLQSVVDSVNKELNEGGEKTEEKPKSREELAAEVNKKLEELKEAEEFLGYAETALRLTNTREGKASEGKIKELEEQKEKWRQRKEKANAAYWEAKEKLNAASVDSSSTYKTSKKTEKNLKEVMSDLGSSGDVSTMDKRMRNLYSVAMAANTLGKETSDSKKWGQVVDSMDKFAKDKLKSAGISEDGGLSNNDVRKMSDVNLMEMKFALKREFGNNSSSLKKVENALKKRIKEMPESKAKQYKAALKSDRGGDFVALQTGALED